MTRSTVSPARPSPPPTGPAGQATYTYDAVGNRLTRASTVPGLSAQSFGYDVNDRLTSDTYDANGNTTVGQVPQPTASQVPVPSRPRRRSPTATTSKTGSRRAPAAASTSACFTTATASAWPRPSTARPSTYLVDELNPTGYAQVVEERTNGAVTRTYTYGHDLLAQDTREGSGQWRASYFGYDGHGSVRLLTDELGSVTDTYAYDAFGTLLASTGTTANRYRYAGEEFDPALGLYHLRARYLNAANRPLLERGHLRRRPRDPHSLHRYTYAYNNPANLSDPSGNTPTLARR